MGISSSVLGENCKCTLAYHHGGISMPNQRLREKQSLMPEVVLRSAHEWWPSIHKESMEDREDCGGVTHYCQSWAGSSMAAGLTSLNISYRGF